MEWDPDIDYFDLPDSNNSKKPFMRKGEGKLASQSHGKTEFSLKRQNSVIIDQLKSEKQHHQYNVKTNELVEKYRNDAKKGAKKDAWK